MAAAAGDGSSYVNGHVSGYRVFVIDAATTIQATVEGAGMAHTRGRGYYQLGDKKEDISATKKLVVLSSDGTAEDRPDEARALLARLSHVEANWLDERLARRVGHQSVEHALLRLAHVHEQRVEAVVVLIVEAEEVG